MPIEISQARNDDDKSRLVPWQKEWSTPGEPLRFEGYIHFRFVNSADNSNTVANAAWSRQPYADSSDLGENVFAGDKLGTLKRDKNAIIGGYLLGGE
jgi:hypothetical protein